MGRFGKILFVIGFIVIIAGVFAYRLYHKPHRDIALERPAYSLTADRLFEDYEANEAAADKKYLDQVLEVTGVVEDITINSDARTVYTLTAAEAMIGGVSATMADDGGTGQAGDEMTFKCRCTGKLMDVVLVDCSIVKGSK